MMDLYILVGDSNVRKTSTVRALTGAQFAKSLENRRNWLVDFDGVTHWTFVLTGALQESKISIEVAIDEIEKAKVKKAIFPLRDIGIGLYPEANKYVLSFLSKRWKVHIAAMQPHIGVQRFTSWKDVHGAASWPTNYTASELRAAWGIS